jgi:hypothetical protein
LKERCSYSVVTVCGRVGGEGDYFDVFDKKKLTFKME